MAQKSVNQKEAGMAEVTAARCCPTGHPTWHYSVSCQDQHEPLRVSSPAAGNPHSSKPTLLKLHPPRSSLEGEKGLESKPTLFGGEKNRGAFGRGEGYRLPRAAAGCLPAAVLPLQPVCLSHGCRELPGAARAVRKTGSRTGGLWAGNREHGSSWETLRGPGQGRPPCRGRAAAGAGEGLGTAAPLVLHIPGGNSIFGGSRAPGRNSRAAFGARPWLSRWDLAALGSGVSAG